MVSTSIGARPMRNSRKKRKIKAHASRSRIRSWVSQSGKFERHVGEIGFSAAARRLEREHEETLSVLRSGDNDFLDTKGDALYAIWNDDAESEAEEEDGHEEPVSEEEVDEDSDGDEWASDDCYTSDEEDPSEDTD